MRIGLVTYWFNRGQATVMRTLRRALDESGHRTFVLARPTTANFTRPNYVAADDIWNQPGITKAHGFDIGFDEYLGWARANRLDSIVFFQNKSFDTIKQLRTAGFATAGTYMWEDFTQAEAEAAHNAFDVLYALNSWTSTRYRELGLSRIVDIPFAIHPSEAIDPPSGKRNGTSFLFAGGYLSERKPLGVVIDAFRAGAAGDARLIVKSQRPIRPGDLVRPVDLPALRGRHQAHPSDAVAPTLNGADDRIQQITADLPSEQHSALLSSVDVVIGVSRWEGLGLHLYELESSGRPIIVNEMEPYVSHCADRGNCVMVRSREIGRLRGIPVHEPDLDSLARMFERLSDPLDHAFDRRPTDPNPAWRRMVKALDAMVTTSLCHHGDRRLRSEN